MNPVPFSSSSNESTPTPTGFHNRRNGYSSQRRQIPPSSKETTSPLFLRIITSNILFYGFGFLSFLLLITLFQYLLPTVYCQNNETFYCEECPPNWICNRTEKICPSNDTFEDEYCITENSTAQIARDIYDAVKEGIAQSSNFNELKQLFKDNETITSEVLTIAVRMCGYSLHHDQIKPIPSSRNQKLFIITAFLISLSMYFISFFTRYSQTKRFF